MEIPLLSRIWKSSHLSEYGNSQAYRDMEILHYSLSNHYIIILDMEILLRLFHPGFFFSQDSGPEFCYPFSN